MSDHGKILFEWTFPEFVVHDRGTAWYFFTTLIGGAFLLGALFTSNFLFALIIILVTILLVLYHKRGPRSVRCKITEQGVLYGDVFYPFQEMENFRIVDEPPLVQNLYITFSSITKPRLTMVLDNQDIKKIRTILQSRLLEDVESTGEPFTDVLSRMLKL